MIYPSKNSALLIIDMLNDFVEEKGSLYVPGGMGIVDPIADLASLFREKGLPVIYVCDSHTEGDSEFKLWPPHAVKGTWGAEVVEGLKPKSGDEVVLKRRYSGFFGTSLDNLLKGKGVKDLYLTGLLTDVCVFFTANDAYNLGYNVFVPENSTVSLDDTTKREFLSRMQKLFGATLV